MKRGTGGDSLLQFTFHHFAEKHIVSASQFVPLDFSNKVYLYFKGFTIPRT